MISFVVITLGLCLFEAVSSLDNAIINAEVLSTMQERARRWFLMWGMLFAVFFVRGFLPWLIVWVSVPGIGFFDAFTAFFSGDPAVQESIEKSAPFLLMGGGIFLLFLFLHWVFLEAKSYGLAIEPFFEKRGVWFYSIVSIVLLVTVWYAMKIDSMLGFAAVVGSTTFFITHGFKSQAEEAEKSLSTKKMTDIAKIMYLEVIDLTFSIDGVLGAFAFTLIVPIILVGNGLGAILVRQLTIKNIDTLKKYVFMKNGAMYSIMFLGVIMMMSGFGIHIPHWLSPLVTVLVILYFFLKSKKTLAY